MERQRPREPVDEIEQVHPLVDQLATTRALGLGAPLAVVARPAAVAVARTEMEQIAVDARPDLSREVRDRGVEAMVEPDLDTPAGVPLRALQMRYLLGADPG